MTITREKITAAMTQLDRLNLINKIICPGKENIRGCHLGRIVITPECCWSTIHLPQWVKLEDEPGAHSYRFYCDESGKFLAWVK